MQAAQDGRIRRCSKAALRDLLTFIEFEIQQFASSREFDLIHKVFDVSKLSASFIDEVILVLVLDDPKSTSASRFFGRIFEGLLDPGLYQF